MSTLRTSSYTISVKLEEEEDKYMLVHGYTGAIDIVNGKIAEYLQKDQIVVEDNIPFSKTTLSKLLIRGYVTSKSIVEEREHVKHWAELFHHRDKTRPKSYMFLVSYDCNFRCPYCYEGGISGAGHKWSKQTFTPQMVDRAYEAMKEIEPGINQHQKAITLYGGEPLLKNNREIVEYIVKQGKKLGYYFHAITNGHDLDFFEDLLGEDMINFIQVTLDGAKELHDQRRYHYQTHTSFDKIFENIGLALRKGIKVSIRINTDAYNFSEIKKLITLFKEAGYYDSKNFIFSAALLRNDENQVTSDSALNKNIKKNDPEDNISYLSREEFNKKFIEEKLNVNMQDYGIYQKLFSAIKQNKLLNFNSIFCAVQTNAYIFDPYGEIYGCWETVGVQEHIIGNYEQTVQWRQEIEKWHQRNIGTTPQCSICKYSFLCGGGCVAKALRIKRNFKGSYCDNYAGTFKVIANNVYKTIATSIKNNN